MKRLRTHIMQALLGALAPAMTSSISSASVQGLDLEARLSAVAAARATAVSGPMISVSPLDLDFGVVNIGRTESRGLTIQNIGDAELELVNLRTSDPQLTTNAPLPLSIAPGGSFTASVTYTPTGGSLAGTLEFQSNAINGPYRTNATGRGNSAPVLEPIGDISAVALLPLRFAVTTTDLDSDPVSLSVDGLPSGATFDPGVGEFAWTPGFQDEGVHTLTFAATDGFATDTEAVEITVAVLNRPPVADPGGPYSGEIGAPIQFDGSGSSDPDGNLLAFSWDFGDGTAGTGIDPTHTYAFGGEYSVRLGVTDDGFGNLSDSAMTTTSIRGVPSGFGTASMDGTLAPGEWDNANRFDFRVNVPESDGGGTTAATLRVMNDVSNLYFAVEVARPSFGGNTGASFEFDNNADGLRQDGDDIFGVNVGAFLPAEFIDVYRHTCPGAEPGCPGCGFEDAAVLEGFPPPGTSDGATAAQNDGALTVIELSHPLNSADDLHDFSLAPGMRTSFAVSIRLIGRCNEWPLCFGDTDFPAHATHLGCSTELYQELIVAHPPAVDHAPQVLAPGSVGGSENAPITFEISASDPDGDPIASMTAAPLPLGASFAPGVGNTSGSINWIPNFMQAGSYSVTFTAQNALSGTAVTVVTIADVNRAPVANAGGPYFGVVGVAGSLDATASSDPDGDALTFAWNFGDGGTGTGATPSHAYTAEGTFNVTLRVTDPGGRYGDAATTATIRTEIAVVVMLKNDGTTLDARKGKGHSKVAIEETGHRYSGILATTLQLTTDFPNSGTVSSCPAEHKAGTGTIGDTNENGIPDYQISFAGSCVKNLFSNVPNNSTVNVIILGQFAISTGTSPLRGVKAVTVRTEGAAAPISASAYPNPFNPETSISYTVESAGLVTLRIYSIDGRLVRTLMQAEATVAGTHEVTWNGTDDQGRHVSSGIYFVKTTQKAGATEESSAFKLVMTK